MLFLGGSEASSEGDNEGLNDAVRESGILLFPLKLPGFGGQLILRIFRAHTHACVNDRRAVATVAAIDAANTTSAATVV